MENYFEIGKITGTHGIRGTMRVFPTTQDPTRFERLKEITVEIHSEGGISEKYDSADGKGNQ